MNQQQTVIFWKPELVISAQPSGLYVAIKAAAPSAGVAQSNVRR
jgi:hypothetical protein